MQSGSTFWARVSFYTTIVKFYESFKKIGDGKLRYFSCKLRKSCQLSLSYRGVCSNRISPAWNCTFFLSVSYDEFLMNRSLSCSAWFQQKTFRSSCFTWKQSLIRKVLLHSFSLWFRTNPLKQPFFSAYSLPAARFFGENRWGWVFWLPMKQTCYLLLVKMLTFSPNQIMQISCINVCSTVLPDLATPPNLTYKVSFFN